MNMIVELRPLSEKDNLEELSLQKVNWDIYLEGDSDDESSGSYQCVRIEERPHGEGGRHGINRFYVHPLGTEPTVENLTPFWGEPILWGIHFQKRHYYKYKWNRDSIESSGNCWITRNGKKFYEISGRDYQYALASAQVKLMEIQESLPMDINERDWDKKELGRKIEWYNLPCTIERFVLDQGCMMLKLDTPIDEREVYNNFDEDDITEIFDSVKVEYLCPHIEWYPRERK